MFSENQKISLRQTYRLFVFDLLGVGTLLLPTQLAGLCGNDGIWCILFGGLLGWGYLLLLGATLKNMKTDMLTFLKQRMPGWIQKLLLILLIVYSLAIAGFCSYVFTTLIRRSLVSEESFVLILALILLVSGYAVSGGMESRSRVYEILFLFVLIPLVIMLAAAAKDVEPSLLLPLFTFQKANLWKGTYLVFLTFSVVFYILFFPNCVKEEDRKKLVACVGRALVITIVILVALYLILLGSFGAAALSHMRFPVVTLMSTVQVKGNFIKRADALMLGVWFFTLFAILNLHMYYASKLSEELLSKKGTKRYIATVAVFVFLCAIAFEYGDGMMSRFLKILEFVGVPMLVVIPVVCLLMGCNSAELEDRCFPMMAAVDYDRKEQSVLFAYTFPRAGIKSDAGQEAAEITVAPVKRKNFKQARTEFEQEVSKRPDPNHLKIVLIGEDFFENTAQYEAMLTLLQEDESFPRNTYVCVAKDTKAILKQDEQSSMDIGSYIEELIENHDRKNGKKLTTLGNLIDEKDNQRRSLRLPYLEVKEDTIIWERDYTIYVKN